VLFPEAQTEWEQKKAQHQSGNHARDSEVRFAAGVAWWMRMRFYEYRAARKSEVGVSWRVRKQNAEVKE